MSHPAPRFSSRPRGGTRRRARCSADQTLPDDADLALARVGGAVRPPPRRRALASRAPSPSAPARGVVGGFPVRPRPAPAHVPRGFGAGVADARTDAPNPLDDHVPVDRFYDGLRQLHASPDVFLVDDFLTPEECGDIVAAASSRDMSRSPVVYAGWTNDVGDIITTAARGPALWAAAASMLSAASADGPGPGALVAGAGAFAAVVAVAAAGAGAWVKYREAQLQGMRTSTSCVLQGESAGERAYVKAAEALMPGSDFRRSRRPP